MRKIWRWWVRKVSPSGRQEQFNRRKLIWLFIKFSLAHTIQQSEVEYSAHETLIWKFMQCLSCSFLASMLHQDAFFLQYKFKCITWVWVCLRNDEKLAHKMTMTTTRKETLCGTKGESRWDKWWKNLFYLKICEPRNHLLSKQFSTV